MTPESSDPSHPNPGPAVRSPAPPGAGRPARAADGLAAAARRAREAWRAEEEEWARAAGEAWGHRRTLVERAVEALHRGDPVSLAGAGFSFVGHLLAVADEYVVLADGSGPVDVALRHVAFLRIRERATTGGSRGEAVVATWRGRWLDREVRGEAVTVGLSPMAEVVTGIPFVGADHVLLWTPRGDEVVTALGAIAYVRDASS